MPKLINLVTVKVKPEYRDRLMGPMMDNARNSVKEAGCHQFDVVQADDDECSFLFYEVYDDAAALAAHRTTPHFMAYWNLMQELGNNVERAARVYTLLE